MSYAGEGLWRKKQKVPRSAGQDKTERHRATMPVKPLSDQVPAISFKLSI